MPAVPRYLIAVRGGQRHLPLATATTDDIAVSGDHGLLTDSLPALNFGQ